MRAVPHVHRQHERAEAGRLDELRSAGAEGLGELGQGPEPEDGAARPARTRRSCSSTSTSRSRAAIGQALDAAIADQFAGPGDPAAGRRRRSRHAAKQKYDGVEHVPDDSTTTAGRALRGRPSARSQAQVAADRPLPRAGARALLRLRHRSGRPGRPLQLLQLDRSPCRSPTSSVSATTARRSAIPPSGRR